MHGSVYVLGTMDTKGAEVRFVVDALRQRGVRALAIDVGTRSDATHAADLSLHEHAALRSLDRGAAVSRMAEVLIPFLVDACQRGELAGVIGLGGSGGTALITPAMRALPIGIPKIMVSTVASGNIAPYIGCSDIAMFPSIVDVAGLNAVSMRILGNAAHAMAGMVDGGPLETTSRPAVGLTMFGVTTPCVDAVRTSLETRGMDCLVFHATGIGGRAMEGLVQSGFIEGLLDLTTTEVADEVVGGVFPAGPLRFDVLATRSIPCVLSVGAMDMVNFGAMDTVPEAFRSRRLHVHNANVTLMRTTPDENRRCAQWMAPKLAKAAGPIAILLPEGGVSALDAPGKPFYDPDADAVLFETLETLLRGVGHIRIERVPAHINDPFFSQRAVDAFLALRSQPPRP